MKHAVILALTLTGCAATQHQRAADAEGILAEAGFERLAVDPQQAKTIKPLELHARAERGKVMYEFVDPKHCACRYVGDANELDTLHKLRAARKEEHERLLKAWIPGFSSPDPRLWGPWKPMGLDVKTRG